MCECHDWVRGYIDKMDVLKVDIEDSELRRRVVERQRTISRSWVASVSRVTADDLKIEWNQIDVYLKEMEDQILKDDVEAALFWNVFVARDDVEVTTEGGKVTLTGDVDDVRAFHEAADAARRAGAEVVYNRLEIEKPS